jgi:hypothetical protein
MLIRGPYEMHQKGRYICGGVMVVATPRTDGEVQWIYRRPLVMFQERHISWKSGRGITDIRQDTETRTQLISVPVFRQTESGRCRF